MNPIHLLYQSEEQEISVTDSIDLNKRFLIVFRRFKLSITWGPINNSSSDISLFIADLYFQQSIVDFLQFPSLFYCWVLHNQMTQYRKRESHIQSTTHPPKYTLTYSSDLSSSLFQGIDPNDRPDSDPTTAVSPEGQRVKSLDCI